MLQATSEASQAIAMLIDLAQKGEIDPWDVQVIEVIDRFLAELGLDNLNNLPPQDTDLSHSGQVMLWASMLVLYKADTLHNSQQEENEAESSETEVEDSQDDSQKRKYLSQDLHKRITRRTSANLPSKRKVTLNELIAQLQTMEKELKNSQLSHRLPLKKKTRLYTETSSQNYH